MVITFLANVFILYPLKTPENQRFSSVFRGYKMGTTAKNGLIKESQIYLVIKARLIIQIYESALKHSGYKSEMKFDQQPSTRRNRNRKLICFYHPFSQNVKANIGKLFFKLVWKNFPKNHRFRKIFNLITLKLSYSSMANLNG